MTSARLTPHEAADWFARAVAHVAADTNVVAGADKRGNRRVRLITAIWCKTLLFQKTSDVIAQADLARYCGHDKIDKATMQPLISGGHVVWKQGTRTVNGRGAQHGQFTIPELPPAPATFPYVERSSQTTLVLVAIRELFYAIANTDPLPRRNTVPWLSTLSACVWMAATGRFQAVQTTTEFGLPVGLVEPELTSGSAADIQRNQERRKKQRKAVSRGMADLLGPFGQVRLTGQGAGAPWAVTISPDIVEIARNVVTNEPAMARAHRQATLEGAATWGEATDGSPPSSPATPPTPTASDGGAAGFDAGGSPPSVVQPALWVGAENVTPGPPGQPLRAVKPAQSCQSVVDEVVGYWRKRDSTRAIRLRAALGARVGTRDVARNLRDVIRRALDAGVHERDVVGLLTEGLADVPADAAPTAAVEAVEAATRRRMAARPREAADAEPLPLAQNQ